MIGNDVIDLKLAKSESNWRRNGYLEKIYTVREQEIIRMADDDILVHLIWSMKESAYKIWNRQTQIRKFNPQHFACHIDSLHNSKASGRIFFDGNIAFSKSRITGELIETVACLTGADLLKAKKISPENTIKSEGLPFSTCGNVASLSHHGRFCAAVCLIEGRGVLST